MELFRQVCYKDRDMQGVVLRTVYSCWASHKQASPLRPRPSPQMLTILSDKLLKMRIVEPVCLVLWAFCPDMQDELQRNWLWEVVNVSILRLHCQIQILLRDIKGLKQQQERQKKFADVAAPDEFEDLSGELVERQKEVADLSVSLDEICVLVCEVGGRGAG